MITEGGGASLREDSLCREPEKERANQAVVLQYVTYNGLDIQHASHELQADLDVVRCAVLQNGAALFHAAPNCLHDSSLCEVACGTCGDMLQRLPAEMQGCKTIVLAAMSCNGLQLQHASRDLRNDLDVVLAAVLNDSRAMEYVSEALKREMWPGSPDPPKIKPNAQPKLKLGGSFR